MASWSMKGGDKFMARINQIAAKNASPPELHVGFLENATEVDGTNVATVAFLNEFGTDRIPPRPFFRNMIGEKSGQWGPNAATLFRRTEDITQVAETLGTLISSQLRQSILSNTPPPNAPATIARKGHGTTLVDTGTMSNSVDHEVVHGGGGGAAAPSSGGGGGGGGAPSGPAPRSGRGDGRYGEGHLPGMTTWSGRKIT